SSLEELLFGYEANPNEGNRISDKKGLFEEANKGTIFLDEISSISLQLQEKLLHVIRDKKIYRIDGTTSIRLDIRSITATNAYLEYAVTEQAFIDDLYYYFNTLPIHISTLKNRLNDMPDVIHHILRKLIQLDGSNVTTVSDSELMKLCVYTWPGNV